MADLRLQAGAPWAAAAADRRPEAGASWMTEVVEVAADRRLQVDVPWVAVADHQLPADVPRAAASYQALQALAASSVWRKRLERLAIGRAHV